MESTGMLSTAMVDVFGDSKELCEGSAILARVYAFRSSYAKALQAGAHAYEVATRLGDSRLIGLALSRNASTRLCMGNWAEAKLLSAQAVAKLAEAGDTLELGLAYAAGFSAHLHLGEVVEATAWAQQGLNLVERAGNKASAILLLGCVARGKALQADHDAATAAIDKIIALAEGAGKDFLVHHVTPVYRWALGTNLRLQGNYDGAVKQLERIADWVWEWQRVGMDPEYMLAYYDLAHSLLAHPSGHQGRASKRAVLRLTQFSKAYPNLLPRAQLAKALHDWQVGRRASALQGFSQAANTAKAQGARLALAEIYLESGRAKLHGNAELKRAAGAAFEQAAKIGTECGAAALVAAAQSGLQQCSGAAA